MMNPRQLQLNLATRNGGGAGLGYLEMFRKSETPPSSELSALGRQQYRLER